MVQQLDYLGLPFRCTSCRQTGYLRKYCQVGSGNFEVEENLDLGSKDLPYIEEEQEESGALGGFASLCS
jgi:hypothetical protein